MNTTLKTALAALLVASATLPAKAQIADQNTSVTGGPVYVEEEDVDLPLPAHNGLTINGAVGLPLNPTAQIPAKGSYRVQANYFDLYKDSLSDTDSKLYGVYVAGAVTDRLEVNAGIERQSVSSSSAPFEESIDGSGLALGVKYLLGKQSNPEDVRFAVGAGYSKALFKNTHIYGVASKGFGSGRRVITGHLGVRWDRFKVNVDGGSLGSGSFSSSKVSAFAGAEVPIDSRGRFNLVGEIQSKNADSDLGGAAPYSVSLRYQSDNGFSASLGVARQGVLSDIVDRDRGFFAQVGKTF